MQKMTTTAVSTAVPPVVLVSANSLFLLTLTNRYSNLTNRLRQVTILQQAEILYARVLVMRTFGAQGRQSLRACSEPAWSSWSTRSSPF